MRATIIVSWLWFAACGGEARGKSPGQAPKPEAEGGAPDASATEAGSGGSGGDAGAPCPEHCFDGIRNDAETDVDCGGDCNPCLPPVSCVAGDCAPPAVCACGFCYLPGDAPSCDADPPTGARCE